MLKRITSFCLTLCLVTLLISTAHAQAPLGLPSGSNTSYVAGGIRLPFDNSPWALLHTDRKVFLRKALFAGTFGGVFEYSQIFEVRGDRRIVSVCQKSDDSNVFLILLQDGFVVRFDADEFNTKNVGRIETGSPNSLKKIAGDALYALDLYGKMSISRDTAATWTIDTLGFNSAYPADFTLDSTQYVYGN